MTPYTIHPHGPGSDTYGDRQHPSFTLWPNGAILTGITRAEAQVIVRALNGALRDGKLKPVKLPRFLRPVGEG